MASTENFAGDDRFSLEECDQVSWSVFDAQFRRCQYAPSDVVFARKGRLGFARPYGNEQKVFSHTVVIIKTKDTAVLTNDYLLWAVRDRAFFSEIDKRMNSNSGVPTLGLEFISAIPIRLPTPNEQLRIAEVLMQSARVIDAEHAILAKLLALKAGLMQDLLTGRNRVTPLLQGAGQLLEQVS